jgi:hypothetical protein
MKRHFCMHLKQVTTNQINCQHLALICRWISQTARVSIIEANRMYRTNLYLLLLDVALGYLVLLLHVSIKSTWIPFSHPEVRGLIFRSTKFLKCIFWDITPCSSLKVNRRFGGTYILHLQARRIIQARNQQPATYFHTGVLLSSFFDPENGGDMLHRNVGWHSTDYTALYPRR